jgi:3-oxoacyl-[acyl-carrier protein] reductase
MWGVARDKGAVQPITGVLARELGPRGIGVNSINPGLVITERLKTIGMHEGEFSGGNR